MEVPLRPEVGICRDVNVHFASHRTTLVPEAHPSRGRGHSAAGCFMPCPEKIGLHVINGNLHSDHASQLAIRDFCTAGLHRHSSSLLLHFAENLTEHLCFSQQHAQAVCFAFVVGESRTLYCIRLELSAQSSGASALAKVDSSYVSQKNLAQQLHGLGGLTCLAAGAAWLCLGGQNGSILCIPLGTSQNALAGTEAMTELRSQAGINRLWDMVGRSKSIGPVQSLSVRMFGDGGVAIHGLVAGHQGGMLRVWNIQRKQLLHTFSPLPPASLQPKASFTDTWVFEETLDPPSELHVAHCYRTNTETLLAVYKLSIQSGNQGVVVRIPEEMSSYIQLPKGDLVDAILLHGVIWLLLLPQGYAGASPPSPSHQPLPPSPLLIRAPLANPGDLMLKCRLLEEQLASSLLLDDEPEQNVMFFEQCLQNPDLAGVELADVIFHRLTAPGMFHETEIMSLLRKHQRTVYGRLEMGSIRKELKAAVAQLDVPASLTDTRGVHEVMRWRQISMDYLQIWQKSHTPLCLLADASTGCVAIVRNSSVSLLRDLGNMEMLLEPLPDISGGVDTEALEKLLQKCSAILRQLLGSLAMATLELKQPTPVLVQALLRLLKISMCQSTPFLSYHIQKQVHQKHAVRSRQLAKTIKSLVSLSGGWKAALDLLEDCLTRSQWVSPTAQVQGSQSLTPRKTFRRSCWLSTTVWQMEGTRTRTARDLLLFLAFIAERPSEFGVLQRDINKLQIQLLPRGEELLRVAQLQLWLTETRPVTSSDDGMPNISKLGIDGEHAIFAGDPLEKGSIAELMLNKLVHELESVSPSSIHLLQAAQECSDCLQWGGSTSMGERPSSFWTRGSNIVQVLHKHQQSAHIETFISRLEELVEMDQFCPEGDSAEQADKKRDMSGIAFLRGISILCRLSGSNEDVQSSIARAVVSFFRAVEGTISYSEIEEMNDLSQDQNLAGVFGKMPKSRLRFLGFIVDQLSKSGVPDTAHFVYAWLREIEQLGPSFDLTSDKNRLWNKLFDLALERLNYEEAFFAIRQNQDVQLQRACVKRLIGSLFEHGKLQMLCGPELPCGQLVKLVSEELKDKAENSDLDGQPNAYRILYSFHTQHHNWRGAAQSMYRFAERLKYERHGLKALQQREKILAETLRALEFLPKSSLWLTSDSVSGSRKSLGDDVSPTKRLRFSLVDTARTSKRINTVTYEEVEREYALATALVELASFNSHHPPPSLSTEAEVAVDTLVNAGLFPTALSLSRLFWTGCALNTRLEKIFSAMARLCCGSQGFTRRSPSQSRSLSLSIGKNTPQRSTGKHTPSSQSFRDMDNEVPGETSAAWELLRKELERHVEGHTHLKEVVATTVLTVDKRIQLPHWLVAMFKEGAPGETGVLLRIFLQAGLMEDATSLALQILEVSSEEDLPNYVSAKLRQRKAVGDSCKPYTTLNLLRSRLVELSETDAHDDANDAKALLDALDGALAKHYKKVAEVSDDLKATARVHEHS